MVQSTPLDASTTGFPASMQAVLARLTAADLLMSSTTTNVYEVTAIVRDLITVCGPELTFKALAQHINDVYTGETGYTVAYYNGSYNSDIIRSLPSGQALSQGQEIALCMFIRADLPLTVMTKVATYPQLVVYLHKRLENTAVTSETALTTTLLTSRKTQYDLSSLVATNGNPSVPITNEIASVAELLTVAANDTNATTTNYRLWLLAKAAVPLHPIHSLNNLTLSTYNTISGSTSVAVQGSSNSAFDIGFTFTSSTATQLFTFDNVIGYILSTTTNTSITHNSTTIYLNGATTVTVGGVTTPVAGVVNSDGLLSQASVDGLTAQSLIAGGATIQKLYQLNIPLNNIIALNTPQYTAITLAQAEAYWPANAIIASNFTFAQKTSNGTDFKYFTITGVQNKDHALLANLIDMYVTVKASTPLNTFVVAVDNAYKTLTSSVNGPSGPRATAIAVLTWLFNNYEAYKPLAADRTPSKIMLAQGLNTSTSFFLSFLAAPAVSTYGLSLYDVFDITKVAEVYDSTGTSLKMGFTPQEAKDNFGVTAGVARDNGWSPALISAIFTPSEIFSNAHKRQNIAYNTASPYALSVIEALLGYNINTNYTFFSTSSNVSSGVTLIDGVTSSYNALVNRYNYDGIPYETLAALLSPSAIIADIKVAMAAAGSTPATAQTSGFSGANATSFPKLSLVGAKISAFLDALALPFPVASSLIGAPYGGNGSTVKEIDLANTTIYSKVERRRLFANLDDAATKYAKSGYPVKSFIALGFPATAWATYASPSNFNNRSVSVSLRELLSATETVEEYDDDFYVTASSTRALYHTVADRVTLIRAFIPDMTESEATLLARGPVSDLPLAVV